MHDGCETLITAVFPGGLNPVAVREVCMNGLNDWTAFDCDEDVGKFALGSGFGKVTCSVVVAPCWFRTSVLSQMKIELKVLVYASVTH